MSPENRFSNPFNQAYLTEGISDLHELLTHYSFLPFNHIGSSIAEPHNMFIVGRKGVGKTMLLRLFGADLLSTLYQEKSSAFTRVRQSIPTAMVGTYVNLSSPAIRVHEFNGREIPNEWWTKAFSDFLNCILTIETLRNITKLSKCSGWLKDSGLSASPIENTDVVWAHLISELRKQSSAYDSITNLEDFQNFTENRIQHWIRFLNHDVPEPPQSPLSLGIPLFAVVAAIRLISPKFRLMLIFDQYEVLHGLRDVIDFRPAFNQAMSESARGGTGVEFKIGTRAYAHKNFSLIIGSGRVETGREVDEVNIDNLSNSYFKDFVADLFAKRLQNSQLTSGQDSTTLAHTLLPGLSPKTEAEKYIRKSTSDTQKHLAAITERWTSYGVSTAEAKSITIQSGLADAHPLIGTLTGIAITRWLRDGRGKTPLNVPAPSNKALSISQQIEYYARMIIPVLEERYELGGARSRAGSPQLRAADDLLAAYEQAALFRIASSYKNQLRYYAGFDTLARISSNVALVFIQIMKTAYNLMALRDGYSKSEPIPPEIQSDAVYTVSEEWQGKIAREYDFGITQDNFLRQIGSYFRALQMEITPTIPTPNGFSVSQDQLGLEEDTQGPRESPIALIQQLVSWGLLEESSHQDKTKGRPPRKRFYLNRVLCPFFKLSDQHLKDPIYIKDLNRFVKCLSDDRTPPEIESAFKASRGSESIQGMQSLFNED